MLSVLSGLVSFALNIFFFQEGGENIASIGETLVPTAELGKATSAAACGPDVGTSEKPKGMYGRKSNLYEIYDILFCVLVASPCRLHYFQF